MKRTIKFTMFLLLVTVFLGATVAQGVVIPQPPQQSFDKTTTGSIPDLDQNRDYAPPVGVNETTWCAPTASADSVWYFGKGGYPNLIPAGANDIAKADALIIALGGLMGTADPNGTTIANTVNGLQQYFNNNYPGVFTVSLHTAWTVPDNAGAPSAINLWNLMTNELYSCSDVLPIIWFPGAGPGQHQNPPSDDDEIINTNLDSIGGHLVMMTGYNIANYPGTIDIVDPDDNIPASTHIFPPNVVPVNWNLAIVGGSPQGTALSINGGAGGWIVGAIVATPEPATLALLLVGGLVILGRKRS